MKPSTSPFKSKKITRSSSKLASVANEIGASDPNTPEKPIQLCNRSRNRGVAFSVSEVREIAKGLQKSNKGPSDQLDLTKSSRKTANKFGSDFKSSKKPTCSIKLPEKYEMMAKFFDSMECSIRLLRMKGKMTNFANICPGIESLTDRRFSYNHLAQLNYILPEAIVLEKVLLQDEKTLCMKPDLQVTLKTDVLENNGGQKGGSGYLSLSKLFRARLLDFVKVHPEGNEIPEETLPEPFNRTKQNILSNLNEAQVSSLPVESLPEAIPHQYSAVASHLSQSFQRRFAHRIPIHESEKTQLLSTTLKPSTPAVPYSCFKETCSNEEIRSSVVPSLQHSKPPTIRRTSVSGASPIKISFSSPLTTYNEEDKPTKNKDCSPTEIDHSHGTPAKLISTPAKPMTVTPDLQTPKRCHMIEDDDSIASPNKLLRRPPRNRSLFTTPIKNAKSETEKSEMGRSSADADIIKLLPESLLQSIREKEKKAIEERDMGILQARRRRQMLASLPKLFNMIHLIFQSIKRWVITKEELMHKIIVGHCDIVDRNEVEEQLKLLQELVPDWIWEKVASSGDLLICINKMSCPELIQKRLANAV